jgi:hypothetical protein
MKTKYHKLAEKIINLPSWDDLTDTKEELFSLVKEVYNEHLKFEKVRNENGRYGIRYYTVPEDSRFSDVYISMFHTEKERDLVFDSWDKEVNWDNVFEQELEYPTPHNMVKKEKIIKEGKTIYVEDK